jgi:hypothetical protein
MTEPRAVLRSRRRRPSGDELPEDLRAWFAGESPAEPPPWSALLPPDHLLLAERWRRWSRDHPGARPPAYLAAVLAREAQR